MAAKTNGAEFKRFYSDDAWWAKPTDSTDPDYTWWEDATIEVNGAEVEEPENCADTDEVVIHAGVVFGKVVGAEEPSLEGYFKRWKKAQTVETICVEIPKDRRDEIVKTLGGMGLKVV